MPMQFIYPRLKDLIKWVEQRGAKIVQTSHTVPEVDTMVLRHNCYVLARKTVR